MPAEKVTNKENQLNPEKSGKSSIPSSPPKFRLPRLRWIILSLILLITAFIVVDYIKNDLLRPPLIMGSVVDSEGKAIVGAVVVGDNKAATTNPSGVFYLEARETDPLLVSAIGYEPKNSTGENLTVSLAQLPTADVRVYVVDEDYNDLKGAVVVRLDPNNSAPVEELVTDETGIATFLGIPSGQAAFVVLHPDWGIGWVETSIEPGGYSRPVVQLRQLQGIKSESRGNTLIGKVYAQDEQGLIGKNSVLYNITDIRYVGDKTFEIVQDSYTTVAVSFNKENLAIYAGFLEAKRLLFPGGGTSLSQDAGRIGNIFEGTGLTSGVRTFHITPNSSDTRYAVNSPTAIEYKNIDGKVVTTDVVGQLNVVKQKSFRIELKDVSDSDILAFIDRNPAVKTKTGSGETWTPETWVRENGGVTATYWAQFPTKDLPPGSEITLGKGKVRVEVCCKGAEGGGGEGVLAEISSDTSKTSPATVKDLRDSKSFTFNTEAGMVTRDFTPIQEFLRDNPSLEFTDKSGRKIKLSNIAPPDPSDAPTDFLIGHFESRDQLRDMYKSGSPEYAKKWQEYLALKAFNNPNSLTQIYDNLVRSIGFHSGFRENPESRKNTQPPPPPQGDKLDSTDVPQDIDQDQPLPPPDTSDPNNNQGSLEPPSNCGGTTCSR